MSKISKTPEPPYYAVIFTSERTEGDNGYGQMAQEMVELVSKQKGFLGAESVRDQDGFGITVSYWDSLEAIKNWKENLRHQVAQERGKKEWYKRFKTRVCMVERDTFFDSEN
jgi:heme-degrading monooxygenase HmoA